MNLLVSRSLIKCNPVAPTPSLLKHHSQHLGLVGVVKLVEHSSAHWDFHRVLASPDAAEHALLHVVDTFLVGGELLVAESAVCVFLASRTLDGKINHGAALA